MTAAVLVAYPCWSLPPAGLSRSTNALLRSTGYLLKSSPAVTESPDNQPAGGGNVVQRNTHTITVKWDACQDGSVNPSVTKEANPSLGSGQNRKGR
jgi:hypothetical protein